MEKDKKKEEEEYLYCFVRYVSIVLTLQIMISVLPTGIMEEFEFSCKEQLDSFVKIYISS